MRKALALLRRFAALFRRNQTDRDLAEELEANLQFHIDDNIARGMTPDEARRQALIRLGGMQQTKEAYRAQNGLPLFERFVADVRFALRMLRKDATFTVVTVLTLALGIGSATAVFTVANAVLMRRMPYPDSERIVLVWGSDRRAVDRGQVSYVDIEDVRHRNRVFSAVCNYADWFPTLSGYGEPERLAATQVSDKFFDIIGVQPFLGRAFTSEENIDGRDRVVILSYALWKAKFNSDPSIVGRAIPLNSVPHVVVGIMPQDFEQLPSTLVQGGQLYRPIGENYDETQRRADHLRAIARLKPGVTIQQAQEDVDRIARELEIEHPKENTDVRFHIAGLQADTASILRPSVMLLIGAVLTLLIIACSNVAGLLLARGNARQREFAVRAALGASRGRIVRQALTESLVLAVLGSALGMVIAFAATRACVALAPKLGSPLAYATVDLRVLLFAAATAIITAMLFGVGPAFHSTVADPMFALKQGAQTSHVNRGARRLHAFVVAGELALALVMLSSASLLVRSFVRLQHVDIGFQPENRLVMNVWLPSVKYPKPEQQRAFFDELLRHVSALPGVHAAAVTQNPPLLNFDGRAALREGWPDTPENVYSPQTYSVTPGYLQAMGITLLRGRWFTDADNTNSQYVAVISEKLAQKFWPGEDAIGKRLQMYSDKKVDGKYSYRTVVGVVAEVLHLGPDAPTRPSLYLPYAQFTVPYMSIVVHAEKPLALAPSIRREVAALDSDIAVFKVGTYTGFLADEMLMRRVAMTLIAVFAGMSLFLAAVGLYGLISYVVSRRMPEFGVRAALGAQPADLVRLVVGSGMRLVGVGTVIGVVCSALAVRLVASLIEGTGSPDVTTVSVSVAMLLGVALIASLIPANTAAHADPMTSLRAE